MTSAQEEQVLGQYLDGTSAQIHAVTIQLSEASNLGDSALIIRNMDQVLARWPLGDLREKRDQAREEGIVLSSMSNPDARLIVPDRTLTAVIRETAPSLNKKDVEKGAYRRILGWAGGAVASVLLIVFVLVPLMSDQLAKYIPVESERKLGEASLKQISWALGRFGGREVSFCETPDGSAALDKMVRRIVGFRDLDYDLSVQVMDHGMENAFALPGGHIVLFNGLIQAGSAPEEIAGVFGHELGHVVHRDPTRLALRSAGTVGILGMLLGDFSGGAFVLLLTERLISASYAQDAETNADTLSYELMGDAGLPTLSFAGFFERMAEQFGDEDEGLVSHLASHPDLMSRAQRARDANQVDAGGFDAVLSASEWDALQSICKS